MQYVSFEKDRKYDLIAVGRIAIDFNPLDYFKPLSESQQYRKYLGGSPANVAVGLARLGKKVGFIGKVSDDQFGDYVTNFFASEG
ncbi:MAG: 5-dehydro-2-deoxygluconokinase, partial [Clostridia bacterium]|nr:5-dehydro-2-deoxygluconokinase [Clostridia bacterium]